MMFYQTVKRKKIESLRPRQSPLSCQQTDNNTNWLPHLTTVYHIVNLYCLAVHMDYNSHSKYLQLSTLHVHLTLKIHEIQIKMTYSCRLGSYTKILQEIHHSIRSQLKTGKLRWYACTMHTDFWCSRHTSTSILILVISRHKHIINISVRVH
jgi:hypothetical protein